MRLLQQIIRIKTQNYHEAELNRKFSPETFYEICIFSSIITGTPIKNKDTKNGAYQRLIQAKLSNNLAFIKKNITTLKLHIIEDQTIINQYQALSPEHNPDEETKGSIWNKHTFGALAYED